MFSFCLSPNPERWGNDDSLVLFVGDNRHCTSHDRTARHVCNPKTTSKKRNRSRIDYSPRRFFISRKDAEGRKDFLPPPIEISRVVALVASMRVRLPLLRVATNLLPYGQPDLQPTAKWTSTEHCAGFFNRLRYSWNILHTMDNQCKIENQMSEIGFPASSSDFTFGMARIGLTISSVRRHSERLRVSSVSSVAMISTNTSVMATPERSSDFSSR